MPNSKPNLRVGLIGTGFMGKAHAFGFTNAARVFDLPVEVELHTVADIDEQAAQSAARAYGFANATTDWRDIIRNPDIDIVSITAPNALHKEMSLAAIAAGMVSYGLMNLVMTAAPLATPAEWLAPPDSAGEQTAGH